MPFTMNIIIYGIVAHLCQLSSSTKKLFINKTLSSDKAHIWDYMFWEQLPTVGGSTINQPKGMNNRSIPHKKTRAQNKQNCTQIPTLILVVECHQESLLCSIVVFELQIKLCQVSSEELLVGCLEGCLVIIDGLVIMVCLDECLPHFTGQDTVARIGLQG